MKLRGAAAVCAAAFVAAAGAGVEAFPLGFSVGGGTGWGYYSMSELNAHIGLVAQDNALTIDELGDGVNFRVEGRIWYRRAVALACGYEHYWGETDAAESSSSLSYHAPADVLTIGIVAAVLQIPNAIDICVGVNRCWADAVYGTNELTGRRLTEYKGEDAGYEAYAEVHTNFINPIEMGLQLGYRGLRIESLYDKFGDPGLFDAGSPIEIDYSGVFLYLMAAIRIN